MTNNLPFMKDPGRFLQSYFWGCNEGHCLSLECKKLLARTHRTQTTTDGLKSDGASSEQVIEAVLDCYVHTKVCSRCEPLEKVTCHQGYELIKQRDSALDEAFRMDVMDSALDGDSGSFTPQQLAASIQMELCQQQFTLHMNQCQECRVKRPRGRYNMVAWNIEAARSQRL